MKTRFFTKTAALAVGFLIASTAFAHTTGEVGAAAPGYLRDSSNHPVKNSTGRCWNIATIASGPECEVKPAPAPVPVAAPAPAPEPAPVAPAPAPAPAPVKKITLQSDALFDFDKAALKHKDIKELDEEVAKITSGGVATESIKAVGHTDSVGADSYNNKLSLRRAQAVKEYLVSKGLDANKITVEGKGEHAPVASNKTKEGRAKNRRVDVEFIGVQR